MPRRISGNISTDVRRMLGWLWKKRPKGKGKGFFRRLIESMNR